ncbi:MAG: sugar transferase [Solirubrobacterales bacterium]
MLRRCFDIVFSFLVLCLTGPIVLAAMVAISIESPGSPLFRQRRMGIHGTEFYLVKLRGMYVDARERFPECYEYPSDLNDRDRFFFHNEDDPRITRVGKVLRKFSIDELPNFWNVLRGDMSVVGPRPDIPELAPLYGSDLQSILSVRPGVTSPSKARGRDCLSFAETVQMDLEYVEQRCLRLDVVTIIRTLRDASLGKGVH